VKVKIIELLEEGIGGIFFNFGCDKDFLGEIKDHGSLKKD
jgi:hypothetical protein